VPCLRRATALAYTDADEDAERLLVGGLSSAGSEADEWVETHTGRPSAHDSAVNAGVIDDIPDLDGAGDVDHVTAGVGNVSLTGRPSGEPAETPDLDDIPDMEEDLEEGDDEATAAPPKPTREVTDAAYVLMSSFIFRITAHTLSCHSEIEVAKGNLLQVRTYDVMITYDKYYQTPRIWLLGYDEVSSDLLPPTKTTLLTGLERNHAHSSPNLPRRFCRPRLQDGDHRTVPSLG